MTEEQQLLIDLVESVDFEPILAGCCCRYCDTYYKAEEYGDTWNACISPQCPMVKARLCVARITSEPRCIRCGSVNIRGLLPSGTFCNSCKQAIEM